jgi:hypothetical protein
MLVHPWFALALLISEPLFGDVVFSMPKSGPTIISVDASNAPRVDH